MSPFYRVALPAVVLALAGLVSPVVAAPKPGHDHPFAAVPGASFRLSTRALQCHSRRSRATARG